MLKASRTLNADQFFVHAHPALDRDPSLLPESDWGVWNDGSYDSGDPDNPSRTKVNTTSSVITQITEVRNLVNRTPARFNLLAGDMCYAQAEGDIQPIINPDGPGGSQPDTGNTPRPSASSGGWDYYDPWVWTSWFPMIEPSVGDAVGGRHRQPRHRAVLRAGRGGLRDGRRLRQARLRRPRQAADRPVCLRARLQRAVENVNWSQARYAADEAARGLRAALRAQETLGLRWTTYGSRCATTTPCTSAPPPSGRKRKTRCGRARRLPLWLAPVQVCVLPVGPAQDQAARALADALLAAGLRPRLEPDGSLGARIRHSRQRRDHLIAVIGESEAAVGAVQVTDVGHGFRGLVSAADLVKLAGAAYRERSGQVSWPE